MLTFPTRLLQQAKRASRNADFFASAVPRICGGYRWRDWRNLGEIWANCYSLWQSPIATPMLWFLRCGTRPLVCWAAQSSVAIESKL